MAFEFPSGGVITGSNCVEPSFLLNLKNEIYSVKRDDRFFDFPEPSLKKISCKCQICGRSHGRPRKNKEFVDENRGVTVETGTKTVVKKMDLNLHEQEPFKVLPLLLCQECICKVEISESCYILKPNLSLMRLKYAPLDSFKIRFLRKNEMVTDGKFMLVSIKWESDKYQIYEEAYHFKEHFTDTFDYSILTRMNKEFDKMLQQQKQGSSSGKSLLGFEARRFEEEYDNTPICLPSSPAVESAAYVSQDEFVIAARGCGKTFNAMEAINPILVKPKSTKKIRNEPFWKRFEKRSKKRF